MLRGCTWSIRKYSSGLSVLANTLQSISRASRAIGDNDLVGCDSCAVSLAREVGAEAVLYGWVQKVSDLIINMTILVRSVKTGQIIAAGNASLRGDTDIAWKRGAVWLIAHRLLPAEAGR